MILSKSVGGIGEPTKFQFQYLPRIGMLTELGTLQDLATEKSASMTLKPPRAVLVVMALLGAAAVTCLVFVTGWFSAVPHAFLSSVMTKPQVLQSLS